MQVTIIGSNSAICSSSLYGLSIELGRVFSEKGWVLFNGGSGGVMEAVSKGAQEVVPRTSIVVGILPFQDKNEGNKYLDIVIPSGLGYARNYLLIGAAEFVVALGGGAGTLSEISHAWQLRKPIFCYRHEGWSGKLADTYLDDCSSSKIQGFSSINELLKLIHDAGIDVS